MRNLIIGSGPAAAGVALALAGAADEQIEVLDIGLQLDEPSSRLLAQMAAVDSDAWTTAQVQAVSMQPAAAPAHGRIPQKRAYGSDFPFRDVGQLSGIDAEEGANGYLISPAYGGFSTVWGAQVTPFPKASFRDWPISWEAMEPHYRAIFREVPLAGERDDLEDYFPLLVDSSEDRALPPLNARFERLMQRYEAQRGRVRASGVTLGRARLALRAHRCVRAALCMTGCPYGLIYSASQTFDRLIASGRVSYRSGVLAKKIVEGDTGSTVEAAELSTGRRFEVRADRVFVAAGPTGSTRLALASMANPPSMVRFIESAQFAIPFGSLRTTGDPRRVTRDFTLNQVNLVVALDDDGWSLSQIHLYPYNAAMMDALPTLLRSRIAGPVAGAVLGRLTVGLGYLPSWASPEVHMRVTASTPDGQPALEVLSPRHSRPPMLDAVLSRLASVGEILDLRPVGTLTELSGPAKSYHYGGSFPHRTGGGLDDDSSDAYGRVRGWRRTHIVDSTVFPTVSGATFTLTVMANAHRIASAVMQGVAT